MNSNLSRRRLLAIGTAGFAGSTFLSPLGILPPRIARGNIPTGEYMRQLDEWRFWFAKLKAESFQAAPALATEQSQLTLRVGASGGHSIGFLSTVSFLARYRQQRPSDYRDLLQGVANLPKTEARPTLALRQLDLHRRISAAAPTNGVEVRFKRTYDLAKDRAAALEARHDDRNLSKTLDSLKPPDFLANVKSSQATHNSAPLAARSKLTNAAFDAPLIEDANKELQTRLHEEFRLVNPDVEDRVQSIDTSQLLKYEGGELSLTWVDNTLLANEFHTGIEMGRLAALAYCAMTEVALLSGGNVEFAIPSTGESRPDAIAKAKEFVLNIREADSLSACFGDDQFWRHALDSAPFRPAVRLRIYCTLSSNGGVMRTLDLMTPFLPFDAVQSPAGADAASFTRSNLNIASAITEQFGQPHLVRYKLPKSTLALPEAAFAACAQVYRSTARMIQDTSTRIESLKNSTLTSVSIVPETTCPWTFAGISAAFCNTYLMALHENGLKNQEERAKFRQSINESVDLLLAQSVPQTASQLSNSSAVSPAFVQYASGYRAAIHFSDRVTDLAAQTEGAKKVYSSLRLALPEYFQELQEGKFLTAEEVAARVFGIATQIQSEITALRAEVAKLRLQVEELTKTIGEYEKFLEGLAKLIDEVQTDLSSVSTMEGLKEWKTRNSNLAQRIATTLDDSKMAAIKSLQGLVNTVIAISVDIEANIRADIQATAKVQVNTCGGGVQK